MSLLDGVTGQPIAEELYDSKDPATIMAFLVKYMDPNKRTFVVYFVEGAPATNNGIENQMKLSAMKRAGMPGKSKCGITLW